MKFKDFPLNVRLRLICGFCIRIVGSAIFPFMALYFSEELGKIAAGMKKLQDFTGVRIQTVPIDDGFGRQNVDGCCVAVSGNARAAPDDIRVVDGR